MKTLDMDKIANIKLDEFGRKTKAIKKNALIEFTIEDVPYFMTIRKRQNKWEPLYIYHLKNCLFCSSNEKKLDLDGDVERCDYLYSQLNTLFEAIKRTIRLKLLFL